MWLIVGLGNPGEEYAGTYHNVGFRVLERLAAAANGRANDWWEPCGSALVSDNVIIAGEAAILVMPQTFMNGSGAAMPAVLNRFQAAVQNVIVIYDDIALPLGKIRVREKGS